MKRHASSPDPYRYGVRKGGLMYAVAERDAALPGTAAPSGFGRRTLLSLAAIGSALAAVAWFALDGRLLSDQPGEAGLRASIVELRPAASAPPAERTPAAAPPAEAAPPPPELAFGSKLRESGAGACAGKIDALAASVNASVSQFNTVSNWATSAVDKRLVSVSVAQKYPEGGAVPYAATSVVAAPGPLGVCDAIAVQVVPSPLSCQKVRESFPGGSQYLGEIAGIPLMRGEDGQTMLVPTAANTCVLVGVKTAYAK